MANYCLPEENAVEFLTAIRDGRIKPIDMMDMTSAERRAIFTDIVGDKHAKRVNAEFERKLLLKDQIAGLERWIKSTSGLNKGVKTDLLSRIGRMDNVLDADSKAAFLQDLASQKLKIDVSFEEARIIHQSTKELETLKTKIQPNEPIRSDNRMNYGYKAYAFSEYLKELRSPSGLKRFKDLTPGELAVELMGASKSIVASMDNSFHLRQGLPVLFNNPKIWTNAFLKSHADIVKELGGIDAQAIVKADIMSRPNAINGKYNIGKFDLDINFEEAFPSELPKSIPALRRLYNASESAYNNAALRMRADLADLHIETAERGGVNMTLPENARPIGAFVNALTGRGDIGKLAYMGKDMSLAFFSVRFLKSNYDMLMAPIKRVYKESIIAKRNLFNQEQKYTPGELYAMRKSSNYMMRTAAGIATILTIAEQLWPDSTENDPRSTQFGKVRIGATRFDVSRGMAGLVTLATRGAYWSAGVTTQNENIKYYKTSGGKYYSIEDGKKYGGRDFFVILTDWGAGKFSPGFGVMRDIAKGEHFGGKEVTPLSIASQLTMPITPMTAYELLDNPDSAPFLAAMMLETYGIGASTY